MLDQLERIREHLAAAFPQVPDDVVVVIHNSTGMLALAQPLVLVSRQMAAPAARRYIAGWFSARELHLLSPRALRRRASRVPGSRELLELAPACVYSQMVVGWAHPGLPPPFRPRRTRNQLRWAWLALGAGGHFSGQVPHLRPAIAARLREGPAPDFPPGPRDAWLLGTTVLDLLAHERGERAIVELCLGLEGEPLLALERAFGRSLSATEGVWRSHLSRLASN